MPPKPQQFHHWLRSSSSFPQHCRTALPYAVLPCRIHHWLFFLSSRHIVACMEAVLPQRCGVSRAGVAIENSAWSPEYLINWKLQDNIFNFLCQENLYSEPLFIPDDQIVSNSLLVNLDRHSDGERQASTPASRESENERALRHFPQLNGNQIPEEKINGILTCQLLIKLQYFVKLHTCSCSDKSRRASRVLRPYILRLDRSILICENLKIYIYTILLWIQFLNFTIFHRRPELAMHWRQS